MAKQETTILNLDQAEFDDIKEAGFIPVSVQGKTYKLAIIEISGEINKKIFVAIMGVSDFWDIKDAKFNSIPIIGLTEDNKLYSLISNNNQTLDFNRFDIISGALYEEKYTVTRDGVWSFSKTKVNVSGLNNDSGFCNVVTATSEEALPTTRNANTFYAVVEE